LNLPILSKYSLFRELVCCGPRKLGKQRKMASSAVDQKQPFLLSSTFKAIKPFVFGSVASMSATCCVQPIDMVKVRLQLTGEGGAASSNPIKMGASIIREEGVASLYKGLSAALLRQLTYGTARLGMFRTFTDKLQNEDGSLDFSKRVGCSLTAGGLAAVLGTPADAALVRMQADKTLPVEQRRNFRHVGHALSTTIAESGWKGIFVGTGPTVIRAMSLNVGMLSTYDQIKSELETRTSLGSTAVVSCAKLASGFFASAFSLPFDFIKTRLQKQTPGPDGKLPYNGIMDCARKVAAKEGPMAFYNGFWTYYVRIAPHVMITLFLLEQINAKFDQYVKDQQNLA